MKLVINKKILELGFIPIILTVIMVIGIIILTIILVNKELRKKDEK